MKGVPEEDRRQAVQTEGGKEGEGEHDAAELGEDAGRGDHQLPQQPVGIAAHYRPGEQPADDRARDRGRQGQAGSSGRAPRRTRASLNSPAMLSNVNAPWAVVKAPIGDDQRRDDHEQPEVREERDEGDVVRRPPETASAGPARGGAGWSAVGGRGRDRVSVMSARPLDREAVLLDGDELPVVREVLRRRVALRLRQLDRRGRRGIDRGKRRGVGGSGLLHCR